MGLFEKLKKDWTPEQHASYAVVSAEIREHSKQRPCPEGCGCTEFFDDRQPDEPTGGFGLAGCPCERCD